MWKAIRPSTVPVAVAAPRTLRSCLSMSQHRQSLTAGQLWLDDFALRQFNQRVPSYSGTRINYDECKFVEEVQRRWQEQGSRLVDGYAPFCKHIFVPNFTGAKVGALTITSNNRHLLQSAYSARRPQELPVLSRWFSSQDVQPVPEAKFLDCILYSREQLVKEHLAMPTKGTAEDLPDLPWGIISVKAQHEDYETPMEPITVMRNSLGAAEGGSGVPIDRAAYDASVAYWQDHAAIVGGASPS